MLNIASNARDAMPEGGEFGVAVRNAHGMAEIRLSDTGHGIARSIIDRVFEPFFSTKPAGAGTGLGLATTHSLIAGANGQIHLESEPGRGTTVCIRLPLAIAATPAPRQAIDYAWST
jgi:signal transduction histidine kinase